ncbi:MAG TPA: hypothetical protein VM513_25200 [Kofleriaceae bacterium]|jgi:hypothetical protein|nr:hypothetical protein [Kofleriaceae bacterium]
MWTVTSDVFAWISAAHAEGGAPDLSACKKDVTADIEALADRACQCTDAACTDKVIADLVTLAGCAMKAGADPSKLMSSLEEL